MISRKSARNLVLRIVDTSGYAILGTIVYILCFARSREQVMMAFQAGIVIMLIIVAFAFALHAATRNKAE
jgi:ABC-type sugar transport system permease subunit